MIEWHLETIKISTIKANPKNPRQISKNQLAHLQGLIEKFGLIDKPILNKDHSLIGGHQRIKILKKMKVKNVECWVASEQISDEEIDHLCIGLNLNQGAWDYDILANEYEMIDLLNWGFTEDQLLGLTGEDAIPGSGLTEEDGKVLEPAKEEEAITQLGDLYELGSHRLICGDSASPDILKRILAETKAILMLTDPPYGINMDKGFSGSGGFSGKGKKIPRRKYSDNWDEDRPTKETFKILIEQCDLNIIFGGNFFSDILPRSTHWLVWDKKNTMPTFGDCELAWTNIERKSVKKYEILWNGLLGKEKERFHPTQKPLKLFQEILKDYTKENDNIFDPFLGSGTTLIAAEMLKRNCIGIELSRAYCDVIIKRYINYCAKQGFNAIIKRNGEIISHEGFI